VTARGITCDDIVVVAAIGGRQALWGKVVGTAHYAGGKGTVDVLVMGSMDTSRPSYRQQIIQVDARLVTR